MLGLKACGIKARTVKGHVLIRIVRDVLQPFKLKLPQLSARHGLCLYIINFVHHFPIPLQCIQ